MPTKRLDRLTPAANVPPFKYANKREGLWCVYIIQCSDLSLYCGVTLDIDRRVDEHNGLKLGGAKATASKRPVKLVCIEYITSTNDYTQAKSLAMQKEDLFKRMLRSQKVRFIKERAPSDLHANFDDSRKSAS